MKESLLLLVLLAVVLPVESSAWGSSLPKLNSNAEMLLLANRNRVIRRPASFETKLRSLNEHAPPVVTTTEMDANNDNDPDEEEDIPNEKRVVRVYSELELPFSAEVAYDAYCNLERQPSWSSWLDRVEYVDDDDETNTGKSKWTMKFMGIKYSWESISVRLERPQTIQWKSVSGLRNFGTVNFYEKEQPGKPTTLMTMNMTFVLPRAAAAILRRSGKITSYVREKMIEASMLEFRDIVQQDLKEQNPES